MLTHVRKSEREHAGGAAGIRRGRNIARCAARLGVLALSFVVAGCQGPSDAERALYPGVESARERLQRAVEMNTTELAQLKSDRARLLREIESTKREVATLTIQQRQSAEQKSSLEAALAKLLPELKFLEASLAEAEGRARDVRKQLEKKKVSK